MNVKYKLSMDKLLYNKNMPNGYTPLICSFGFFFFFNMKTSLDKIVS